MHLVTIKFSALKFKKGEEGTHKYTVEEVAGADTTVTYDTMKAEVTVTVSHDGTAKALVADVTEPAEQRVQQYSNSSNRT